MFTGMNLSKANRLDAGRRTHADAALMARIAQLRELRERHAREKVAALELQGSLLSLAALLGGTVADPDGRAVGRLRDVVVRWTESRPYPPVTAIIVRTGRAR
jgi:hypothetical protein